MVVGKGDFPRDVDPPVAAATASGLFSVSPWPLASAGKQRRKTRRGGVFFWLDSGRWPVSSAQHVCPFPPLCLTFSPLSLAHLGLELFQGSKELRPLPLGLHHRGQSLGQGTCDGFHMLLVGGLQLFPLLLGCKCLLP